MLIVILFCSAHTNFMCRLVFRWTLLFNHLFLISKNCGPNRGIHKLSSPEATMQIWISVFQRVPSAAAQLWLLSAASAQLFLWSLPSYQALTLKGCMAFLRLSEDSPSIPSWPCMNKIHIRLLPECWSICYWARIPPWCHLFSFETMSIKIHLVICTKTPPLPPNL